MQLEYLASLYGVQSGALPGAAIRGSQLMHSFDLNLLVRPFGSARLGAYLLACAGVHVRRVAITSALGEGVATICDPWLLVCSARPAAPPAALGVRYSTDFGVQAGAGAWLSLHARLKLYLETRFSFVRGPGLRGPSNELRTGNAQYFPILVGLSF